jgi:hypothetical protein
VENNVPNPVKEVQQHIDIVEAPSPTDAEKKKPHIR